MMIRAAGLLVFVLLIATRAEDQVRSTQEELRRRNIYFGDIDGRRSDEFEEALKRYQRRKGFNASGREDSATLRSLGLLARSPNEAPPKELEWPQEPVLKSDERLDVVAEATEIAAVTGIAPDSVAPEASDLEPIASGRSRGTKGAKARSGAASGRASGASAASGGGRQSGSGEASARGQRSVTPNEMVKFVKNYIGAVEDGDLQDELAMYADRVDYYNNGSVDRRIIENSLRKYYTLWPKRNYSLARVVAYSVSPRRGEITITYNVDFSLRGQKGRVKGTTQNRIVINAATSSPRIVAIRESRVRQ